MTTDKTTYDEPTLVRQVDALVVHEGGKRVQLGCRRKYTERGDQMLRRPSSIATRLDSRSASRE
jgi:hypothetical protein